MAEAHVYRCDACGATLTDALASTAWVEVRGFAGARWKPVHLCGPTCLEGWARQRAARRPVVAALGPGRAP